MTQLRQIKNQSDAIHFCNWLREHAEIEMVQGWHVDRFNTGQIKGFSCGSQHHFADMEWLWSERRALNDWIRTYLADFEQRLSH